MTGVQTCALPIWASKTELLLERLLSEVRDSGDMATQKSLAAAEDFFVTNNGDFKRSPVDVSAFHEQKHFVCFLILLGFQTFLGLLRRSPEPYRASVPGKELSSGGRLDLRPFFGPGAQIFAARQRHRVITLVPRPEVEY